MTEPEETSEGADELEERTYTKADVDRITKQRLARQRASLGDVDALKAKAAKFDELDAMSKSDLQRESEARAAVERERDEAKAEVLRYQVAAAEGLPPELAARLRGNTEAELKADAKELRKLVTPAQATQTAARPVADLKPGALPAGDQQLTSASIDDWIRDKARRR